MSIQANRLYWDGLAAAYQQITRISIDDFHYGPLLAGDRELGLLPSDLKGKHCLEIGCGAGQNSIFLARSGARCTALDVSANQLAYGHSLAGEYGVDVDFRLMDMEALDAVPSASYDLVHSTYALPFVEDQETVIAEAARLLRDGGTLLLTTGHPLFSGEWVELDEGEQGMFLTDYFRPPVDARFCADEKLMIRAMNVPLGKMIDWLLTAGLTLRKVVEPQALPVPTLNDDEIAQRIPYISDDWRMMYEQLSKIPVVVIYLAVKGGGQPA